MQKFQKPRIISILEESLKSSIAELHSETDVIEIRNSYKRNTFGQVTAINLSANGISSLSGIRSLKKLEVLIVSDNKISNIEVLRGFSKLRIVNFSNNRIEDISPLHRNRNLNYLNVEENIIQDFTPLYFQMNQNTDFQLFARMNPPFYRRLDSSLSYDLDWMDARLHNARMLIKENLETKALHLDLGNTGLTDLAMLPELFDCTHLEELILSNEWGSIDGSKWVRNESRNTGTPNNIFHIPLRISELKNLRVLICGGDWATDDEQYPWNRWRLTDLNSFRGMSNLRILNLANNLISGNVDLARLHYLEELYLNNNRINSIKNETMFFKLWLFNISSNRLTKLDFLSTMPELRTFDAHANKIKDLYPARVLIGHIGISYSSWALDTFSIGNNPELKIPNPSIVEQGPAMVLLFFDQLDSERAAKIKSYKNKNLKLILVGNSNAGKSSLSSWLRLKCYDPQIATTHWLEIKSWDTAIGSKNIKIRIFDFGGQEYYHDTHHLFFTNGTAYVVLWDRATNNYNEHLINQKQLNGSYQNVLIQGYPYSYWLDSIDYHCNKRRLTESEKTVASIVVKKQMSLQNDNYPERKNFEPDTHDEENTQDSRKNILLVQNKADRRRDEEYIEQKTLTGAHPNIYAIHQMSVETERGLVYFEDLLKEMFQVMPILEMDIPASWGVIKDKLENGSNNFSKPLSLMQFKKFCNKELKKAESFSVLPEKILADLFFSIENAASLAGYLNDIGLLLFFPENNTLKDKVFINQEKIVRNIYKVLLELNVYHGKFNKQYVAEKLSKRNFDGECRTLLELMMQFKIITRHPSSDDTFIAPLYLPKHPSKGVRLFMKAFKKPTFRFEFKNFIHKHIILEFFQQYGKDTVQDDLNTDSYYYWREGLILNNAAFSEIILVKFVNGTDEHSNCHIDIFSLDNSGDKKFVNQVADDLERIHGDPSILRAVSLDGEVFVPLEMIHQAEESGDLVFKYKDSYYNLLDYRDYLRKPRRMKKVFISYSQHDVSSLRKLENHLTVLKRNGNISTWNCRKLLPGSEWDGKIKQELEDAEVILFLVSDDFLASDYIWDIEIKRAIERAKNGDAVIVPIIVRSCRWQNSPLGIYNSEPPKAEVIGLSENVDEAWTRVVTNLEKIL